MNNALAVRRPAPAAASRTTGTSSHAEPQLKVVLFSGGSGAHSICQTLLKQRQIDLTVLINAYDDGHSTGRLRRFIPGMLGPSDVRKNISRLMPLHERCFRALRSFSDHRLPARVSNQEAAQCIRRIVDGDHEYLPPELVGEFEHLSVGQATGIRRWLGAFLEYGMDQERKGRYFDYRDCAFGNLLFAGCFLEQQRDFNRTIAVLARFYEIRATLLNVTNGENLFLVARKEDGSILRGESDIVATQNTSKITDLMLIDQAVYLSTIDGDRQPDGPVLEEAIRSGARIPAVNPEAADALRRSDIIIYGPGTQHSSLLPSYLTRGVGELIAGNTGAEKIFISNIRRDADLPQEDAADISRKFLRAMTRDGELPLAWNDVATAFLFQRSNGSSRSGPEYIPFDPSRLEYPLEQVRLRDWEDSDGKHAGGFVVNELQQIVQTRMDFVLEPFRHLVSIVIPALDEEGTVEAGLKALAALNFQSIDLSKEILFVDGGSTDRTYEIASAIPGVKCLRLPERQRGRGAAMRFGLEQARGDTVVFFPADLEYSADDIFRVVLAIVRNEYKAVFGTRNVKCTDLSARLSGIYGSERGMYLLSKYGGMLLSMATLLLYNRYVSDPLTCLMGFDASLLRSLQLKANGLDIQTEIVAKLCSRHQYILEVPVDYKPRTRAQGKKTTPLDGFQAMVPLIRGKYASAGR
jgi:2-phospho-L-lactate transferase/gluconeogenesis factor (CofD/UPF0052 family)